MLLTIKKFRTNLRESASHRFPGEAEEESEGAEEEEPHCRLQAEAFSDQAQSQGDQRPDETEDERYDDG